MGKLFFPKLAASNLRKNTKIYLPFMLTCICTVAMFYMICSLSDNSSIQEMSTTVAFMAEASSQIAAVFVGIFLFYTHSFLMKHRKMELGLYNVLGMDKRHIALTIVWETLLTAIVCIIPGLMMGIALDKLMYLTLLKIIGGKITLGFEVSVGMIISTFVLFVVIFLLILIDSLWQIYFSKPVELLKGSKVGEREPKTKWLMTIIGLLSLGSGYYIAVTAKNPAEIINKFFIAVILVMIGTYLLFTAGSIAFLKILRSNKRYYYKTKHFISVSGMIYRMKQNAVGLGNICILSTAVMVMLSTSLSLYIGLEDVLKTRFPQSLILEVNEEDNSIKQLHSITSDILTDNAIVPKNEVNFSYLSFGAILNGNEVITEFGDSMLSYINNICNLIFIPLEDYNEMSKQPQTLTKGELLLYTNRGEYDYNTLQIFGETFSVKETLSDIPCGDIAASDMFISHYIIVENMEIVENIQKTFSETVEEDQDIEFIWHRYAFDLDLESESAIKISELIQNSLNESKVTYKMECLEVMRKDLMGIHGGLLFVGIFFGILFIMATVLIIYYKQITEGYNDKERFTIMKNVGLSRIEIKKTIRSQIITVFFLPLVTAGLHVAFAFPSLTRILMILNLHNIPLFVMCTIVCFAVFTLFYTIVYSLTARAYYRIVG